MSPRQERYQHYMTFLETHKDELSADVRYPIPRYYESEFEAPCYQLWWNEDYSHFDVELLRWWDDDSYMEYQQYDAYNEEEW